MRHKYNLFLIAFSTAILFFGLYTYFSNGLNVMADSNSSLSSENDSKILPSSNDDKISNDTAFLATLTSLRKIRIDTDIFSSKAFKKLNDNTVNLDPILPGRLNPFSPVGLVITPSVDQDISQIITNQPIKILDKTAVLSGTIKSLNGVSSSYFEYGTTPTLGRTTATSVPSLIGVFISNVNGLAPKTTYFYRAVSKINGIVTYGEIISFETK